MATKTDYYNRIISSLQSEITGLKTKINELQKVMEGVKEEMDELKEIKSEGLTKNSNSEPESLYQNSSLVSKTKEKRQAVLATFPKWEISFLVKKMKETCDQAILANHEIYFDTFAYKQEVDNLHKTIEQEYMSSDNFTVHVKEQETRLKSIECRLKSIEEKYRYRFSLLTINRQILNGSQTTKRYFNFNIIDRLKNSSSHWFLSLLTCSIICLLASYLIYSME